jgi:hypothetical protein
VELVKDRRRRTNGLQRGDDPGGPTPPRTDLDPEHQARKRGARQDQPAQVELVRVGSFISSTKIVTSAMPIKPIGTLI